MRLVVAVALLSTVAHADDDLDIAGRDSTELAGDALVWEDAAFYLEPWEGGAMIRFSSFGRARRDEVGRAIPVAIVSSAMRDFVEVELDGAAACTHRRTESDRRISGLRLFVKREDLAPVLAKPFAITYPNGTSARLVPGVPVMPTASGSYVVSARGDVFALPIPHASVGFTYPRGRIDDPAPPKGALWRLERATTVTLGDSDFEARASWLATKPAKHAGDTAQLKWSTRCLDLVVEVPVKALGKAPPPRRSGPFTTHTIGAMQHVIPRGTPLSTFAGREVAVAAQPIGVAPPADGKACFDAVVTMLRLDDIPESRISRTFRLCAPLALVEGPPVPPSPPQADPLAAPPDVAAPPRGAQRTAKGVYFKRLRPAHGRKPTADDTVVVHYTGWTTDGKMFDSSQKRGQPARFPLRTLIAGWTDGLQVMSVGEKIRFWIPEELAYKGSPGAPQGMLVFDVELLGIE